MLSRRVFLRSVTPAVWSASASLGFAADNFPRLFFSLHDVEPRAGKSMDNTEVFAKAIEVVHDRKLGTLWIPAGEYPLRTLQLRDSVVLRGSGREATILEALPGNDPAFVTLHEGPVRHTGLVSLTLRGGTREKARNAQQWALRLVAKPPPTGYPHGGMWWSHFEDITVLNFDRGISLEGGGNSYLLPHQFFSMKDMEVYLPRSARGPNLLMSGQVAQGLFQQCVFDNESPLNAPAIHLTLDESRNVGPSLHHFDVCTVQTADLAFLIDGAQNITISNTWFENDGAGVRVMQGSYGINITGNRFANAGESAPGITFEHDTTGTISGNLYAGERTREISHIASDANVSTDEGTRIWGAGRAR